MKKIASYLTKKSDGYGQKDTQSIGKKTAK